MSSIISLLSIMLVCGFLFLISSNKKAVNWKMIGKGIGLQFIIAFIFLKVPIGQKIVETVANGFTKVIGYGNEGLAFVFGSLSDSTAPSGMVFAISVLGTIVFFSSLVALLQYTGILGFFVSIIGGAMGKVLGTTKAESFVAVSNVFLGQTESPLLVSKYMPKMTKSEIMTVLVAGMGSIAGSVLVGYNLMGIPLENLLIASVLVPVGSILVSKIIQPEDEVSVLDDVKIDRKGDNANVVGAISNGAMNGMQLAMGVGASLIAVVSIVALVNGILGNFGTSLETILGFIFLPIGYMLGLTGADVGMASELIGQKIVLNEFVAFSNMSAMMGDMSTKAQMVISIALCGFANFSSIAICSTGLSIICPEKRSTITSLAFKGMIGGIVVSILSALVVSILM